MSLKEGAQIAVMKFDTDDIQELLLADESEVVALLGLAYLVTVDSPRDLLKAGRNGAFYQSPPLPLGNKLEPPLRHNGLLKAARRFGKEWGNQIKRAICGNQELYAQERKLAARDAYILVGSVTATIAAHVPELAAYVALLNYVGILVVRSGLSAFCNTDFDKLFSE